MMRIAVQIGPNAQSGGFQDGFFSPSYQGPISVSTPPAMATMMAMPAEEPMAQ